MKKLYLISFNPASSNASEFHDILINCPHILNWSHYLAPTYIVVSEKSSEELTDYFIENWPNNRFIVAETTKENVNGWTAKKQWEWLKKH